MSLRAAWWFLAVAAVLTAFSVGVEIYSRKAQYTPPGRVVKLVPDDITSVALYRGADTVARFSREGGVWRYDAPASGIAQGTADRAAVEEIIGFAARAERHPAKISLARAGLENLEKTLQVVYYAGGDNVGIYIGNISENGQERHFVLDSAPTVVLQAPEGMFKVFGREPALYRTRDIFDYADKTPEMLTVTRGQEEIVLRHSSEGWVIAKPFSWPADNQIAGTVLQSLTFLRAKDFLKELPAQAQPAAAVQIKNGEALQSVHFYRETAGGNVYAVREGRKEVYVLDDAALEPLRHPQLAEVLRQRVIDLFPARQVGKIVLTDDEKKNLVMTAGENGWQGRPDGEPAFPLEPAALRQLVETLHHLQLNRVVAEEFKPDLLTGRVLRGRIKVFDTAGAVLGEIAVFGVVNNAEPVFYAQVSGRSQMLELHPLMGMALVQPFLAYRGRALENIDFAAVQGLRIIRHIDNNNEVAFARVNATQFKQVKPRERDLSERSSWEMLDLLRQLAQLRCEGYIVAKKGNLSVYGLDRPLLKSILNYRKQGDGEWQSVLTVGRALSMNISGKDKVYAAMLDTNDYIFILSEKFVDRLLRNY